MDEGSGSWEELDCLHLADDERGDRASLLLGGATGGVALTKHQRVGLLASTGTGTLFLFNAEKLSYGAQRVLCSVVEKGRYTPVGDPFPRPLGCRIIVGSQKPLAALASSLIVGRRLAETLGLVSLSAEDVIKVLEPRRFYKTHPGSLAAESPPAQRTA
ncbi:MAG TPA: sigma 54-interacting transcriptional regulator [Pyrinomonadaceae bacterium]